MTTACGLSHCQIVTSAGELGAMAGPWKELWQRDPEREVFQDFDWASAWLRAFRQGHDPAVAVIYAGDEIAAILPLVTLRGELRFLGYSASDYNTMLCTPRFAGEALAMALDTLAAKRLADWSRLVLENVREGSILAQAIAQLPARWRRVVHCSRPVPCPALVLGDAGDQVLEQLLAKGKVNKVSKTIRRLGEVAFRHLETGKEIREHLPRFAQQHIARCVLDGRRSQFLGQSYVMFCEYLAQDLDPARQLRFSVLEIAGKPVAYHLGFAINGKYLFYKPTFDIEYWDYSPGQVLLVHLLESLRRSNMREFDFGQGGEAYKYRYANVCRGNRTYTIYRPGLGGRIKRMWTQAASAARAEARAAIEKRPALERIPLRVQGIARQIAAGDVMRPARRRLRTLPDAQSASPAVRLREVTLSELAQHAAGAPAFLSAAALHRLRERMKKGALVYAGAAWSYVVLASQGAATEAGDTPGLLFEVLRPARGVPPALRQTMAQMAAERGLKGWLQ
jgi:CelD/BcsL family acetyltransferase involved in cellulose biosynthesis